MGSNVSAGEGGQAGEVGGNPIASDGPMVEDGTTSGGSGGGGTTTTTTGPDHGTTDGLRYDVEYDDVPEVCLAPSYPSCDYLSENLWNALGLNCPGSLVFEASFNGHPEALMVREGQIGTQGVFSPREGERMVVMSTGRAADVPRTPQELGCGPGLCPSTAFAPGAGLEDLPPPIDVRRVSDTHTCAEKPELVGMGDCSNTLEEEWVPGARAFDYAELRLRAEVPPKTDGIAYQFAFFSAEYPSTVTHGSPWNDMYIAWLESEAWTGNISFDQHGHPITIDGVFLDYLDDAPELEGFSMEGHAGTRWLETVAPVRPGEEIEMIFAIFDLNDAAGDSIVLLDNVHWECTDLPPLTHPEC